MPLGKKMVLVVVFLAMASAVAFFIHTSRQAAQARENPQSYAAKVDQAVRQTEKVLDRQSPR